MNPVLSIDVWKWPEWKALCKRLGIPKQPDTAITIRLALNSEVRIDHEYIGQDTSDE